MSARDWLFARFDLLSRGPDGELELLIEGAAPLPRLSCDPRRVRIPTCNCRDGEPCPLGHADCGLRRNARSLEARKP